jgi:hypothetical protein
MTFINALKKYMNQTTTFNGANALKSTGSELVDLFGTIGALRDRSDIEIENKFSNAFAEDKHLAMKLLFYARDVRGGLGERHVAKVIYKHLATLYPDVLRKNLDLISHFGRWDDLLVLLNTSLSADVISLINKQLLSDMDSLTPSLLAKWLPSINTSSAVTREQAQTIIKGLNWHAQKYRQTLSTLRKRIDVLEVKMSAQMWESIHYSGVPSNAMTIYSKAFMRQDEKRFARYIADVKSGQEKINASVLYPYNITESILSNKAVENHEVLEQQWKSMPDFIEGNESNVLVMADVSGSMAGRPMATSIGLALYFAERTKGVFSNHYMTFSESPTLIEVKGNTLYEKVRNALSSNWGMNTDFEKALKTILDTAVSQKIDQEELPKTLIVVSDMQFDQSIMNTNRNWSFYKKMEFMYFASGYKIPEIVFWNVNCLSNVFQAAADYKGVKFASGQAASVFKSILNSKTLTAYDFMVDVLSGERYERVMI